LFVLWEGGGNVPLQLGLANGLVERGHDVRVLTEDCLAADVAAAGCRFEPFVEAPNRASRTEDALWTLKGVLRRAVLGCGNASRTFSDQASRA
jgi:UDP:flavonoid glycosyltransferase YjiC (YdhE family)